MRAEILSAGGKFLLWDFQARLFPSGSQVQRLVSPHKTAAILKADIIQKNRWGNEAERRQLSEKTPLLTHSNVQSHAQGLKKKNPAVAINDVKRQRSRRATPRRVNQTLSLTVCVLCL